MNEFVEYDFIEWKTVYDNILSVKYIKNDPRFGLTIIIEHSNGMRTLYGHAKQLCCNVGDTVSQGEVIALVGTTGQSTGNHLHFEVIVGGRNVNPASYINIG